MGGRARLESELDRDGNDVAVLAARFAAHSNGGLSPELSAELALEIVLNEIAEQACAATGATGAAIALTRDGEIVCRATSGPTAPNLGSRIDANSGLSARCVETRLPQRCDDTLRDSQADAAASEQLGVRSVLVIPLLREEELLGILELFSPQPFAFGENEEAILQAFAQKVLDNLERSQRRLEPEWLPDSETSEAAEPFTEASATEAWLSEAQPAEARPVGVVVPAVPRGNSATLSWLLGVSIILVAILLGLAAGRRLAPKKARVDASATSTGSANAPAAEHETADVQAAQKVNSSDAGASAKSSRSTALPPGSLVVYQNGKQIFRAQPDGTSPQVGTEHTSSVNTLGTGIPELHARLLYHVDPEYPEEALRQKIEGSVVLDVYIAQNGSVQGVQVVSGPEELRDSSIAAVKQWRFKPQMVNGKSAEMQTRVTLNFVLPK